MANPRRFPATKGWFLPPQQGVGHEARHLEQRVGRGAAEGRADDHPLYWDIAGALAVLARTVTDWHRVVIAEPAVEADAISSSTPAMTTKAYRPSWAVVALT